MIFFSNSSIRTKITLVSFFTSFILIVAGLVILTIYDFYKNKDHFYKNIRVQAMLISSQCEEALISNSPDKAEKIINLLTHIESIHMTVIYDINNRPFALYKDSKEELSPIPKPKEMPYFTFQKNDLMIFEPIIHNEKKIGTIFLKAHLDFYNVIKEHILIVAVLICLLIGISLLFARILQKIISDPILYLSSLMERIRPDNSEFFKKIPRKDKDEISVLYDGFDQMMTKIAIHEQKRNLSEKALKTSNETLLKVLDSLKIFIYVCDIDTYELIFINKFAQHIYGNITGKTCWKEIHPEQSGPCSFCPNKQLFDKNNNPSGIYEWEYQDHITKKWFFCQDTAIEWIDGRLAKLQIATDITKLKMNESKIEHKNLELEAAVQKKESEMAEINEENILQEKLATVGQISGNIAHEIRNPLGAIKQSIFYLQSQLQNPSKKIKEHLELINTEMDKANKVINNMLMATKLSHSNFINTDLFKMLQNIRKYTVKKKRIIVHIDMNPKHFIIHADPVHLRQVFTNLIANSMHAISHDGTISIIGKYLDDQKMCRIEILDDGIGMKPEVLAKIYKPLFTTRAKGTGLGMGICKQIIENHGGTINVESKYTHGTKVIILLPIKQKIED